MAQGGRGPFALLHQARQMYPLQWFEFLHPHHANGATGCANLYRRSES